MPLFELENGKPVVKKKSKTKKKSGELTGIQELIRRRRGQMIYHSAIYYHLDNNIISDYTWQQWADELAEIQNKHPDQCNIGYHDEEFKDWNGSTGMHLPFTPAIHQKAEWLIYLSEKYA